MFNHKGDMIALNCITTVSYTHLRDRQTDRSRKKAYEEEMIIYESIKVVKEIP